MPLVSFRSRTGLTGADRVVRDRMTVTLYGSYAVWGWLLARHPAASVTPLSLLVPIFGIGASAGLGYEPLTTWKLTATALVLSGLAVNTLWPRLAVIPPARPR